MCIEIDGAYHLKPEQQAYDTARTAYLENLGYKVIRFSNRDVHYHLEAVVDEIIWVIAVEPSTPA